MTTPNTNVGEAKFTPGPWSIDRLTKTRVVGLDCRGVCSTGGYFNNQDPEGVTAENEANAHLIASAPQMFEALEDVMEFIEREYADRMTWPDIYRQVDKVLDLARGEAHESRGESEGGE